MGRPNRQGREEAAESENEMNDNTSIANQLETISDRLVHIAERTADDWTRESLYGIAADIDRIIDNHEDNNLD